MTMYMIALIFSELKMKHRRYRGQAPLFDRERVVPLGFGDRLEVPLKKKPAYIDPFLVRVPLPSWLVNPAGTVVCHMVYLLCVVTLLAPTQMEAKAWSLLRRPPLTLAEKLRSVRHRMMCHVVLDGGSVDDDVHVMLMAVEDRLLTILSDEDAAAREAAAALEADERMKRRRLKRSVKRRERRRRRAMEKAVLAAAGGRGDVVSKPFLTVDPAHPVIVAMVASAHAAVEAPINGCSEGDGCFDGGSDSSDLSGSLEASSDDDGRGFIRDADSIVADLCALPGGTYELKPSCAVL